MQNSALNKKQEPEENAFNYVFVYVSDIENFLLQVHSVWLPAGQ